MISPDHRLRESHEDALLAFALRVLPFPSAGFLEKCAALKFLRWSEVSLEERNVVERPGQVDEVVTPLRQHLVIFGLGNQTSNANLSRVCPARARKSSLHSDRYSHICL